MIKLHLLLNIHLLSKVMLYILCYICYRNSSTFKEIDRDAHLIINFIKLGAKVKNKFFSKTYILELEGWKFSLRKSSSDIQVFDQIFVRKEYKDALEYILNKLELNSKPTIIDAGANIGCSAVYLGTFKGFEKSTLIALEPFPETTHFLKKNLSINFLSYKVFSAALWSKESSISFDRNYRDGKEWSIRTIENHEGQVKSVSIQSLIKKFALKEIDIFKIDIEGSEFEVFLNSNENVNALEQIKSIVMEIHDDAGSRIELYEKLKACRFDIIEMGELTLFINKNFLK